jgi:hypothetical protein
MMFHWTHPSTLPIVNYQARKHDIDELPCIVNADVDFDLGVPEGPASLVACQRRLCQVAGKRFLLSRSGKDPGILRLVVTERVPFHRDTGEGDVSRRQHAVKPMSCEEAPRTLAWRMYEQADKIDRERNAALAAKTSSRWISVRVDSVSSRHTLFPSSSDDFRPLFLVATLPIHVQEGTKVPIREAMARAKALGSYDCRHGIKDPRPPDRVLAGRTRLIWTRKQKGDATRGSFVSLLTGERTEKGAHRRPREVRVLLRMGGNLLMAARSDSTQDERIPYSDRLLNESLTAAINARSKSKKTLKTINTATAESPVNGTASHDPLTPTKRSRRLLERMSRDGSPSESKRPRR